eukprot:Tbor_TRINITY_DN4427_c0_g1::TRINITY_DN4427_c0_g1_i1::g.8038::m.8038
MHPHQTCSPYIPTSLDPYKAAVPHQQATLEAIRDLCAVHLISLEEQLKRSNVSITPTCRWRRERTEKTPFKTGKSQPVVTIRDCIDRDYRCRSATYLYDLASTVHNLADELIRTHRREVAELRKELSNVKRCVVEWNAEFAQGTSPSDVKSELISLRQRVTDLEREKLVMNANAVARSVQERTLFNLLKSSSQHNDIPLVPVPHFKIQRPVK